MPSSTARSYPILRSSMPAGGIFRAKLGAEIGAILGGNAVQNENGVQCHEMLSSAPGTASDKRLWISESGTREHTSAARE